MNYNKKSTFAIKKIVCTLMLFILLCPSFEAYGVKAATLSSNSDSMIEEKRDEVEEFRAVWVAYYDFSASEGYSSEEFRTYVRDMFTRIKNMNMNAVVVHVRPFSDAMYKSKYYPWSSYASGKQGENPGYDPLKIMVEEAHTLKLQIHAWLNPYRVTSAGMGTDPAVLAEKNPARRWLTDSDKDNDRNVLKFGGQLYYNPSKAQVRKLIVNGIKEIVQNYDVDGIHFDDYFYPSSLGEASYKSNFDAPEYEEYVSNCKAKGKKYKTIENWRRNNVNKLIKSIYSTVKAINKDVVFGISPGGFIDYLDRDYGYYVDYKTWMSKPGYIDYICPQIYWNFDSRCTYPYDTTLKRWVSERKLESVKLYVGIAAYKVNANGADKSYGEGVPEQWKNNKLMNKMVNYGRKKGADGYIFFDYADMVSTRNKKAVKNLKKLFE